MEFPRAAAAAAPTAEHRSRTRGTKRRYNAENGKPCALSEHRVTVAGGRRPDSTVACTETLHLQRNLINE